MGRSGSDTPARARRTASETACTARAWPITRRPISVSIRSSLAVSPSSSRPAGIPVHADTTSATSSGPTSCLTMAAGSEVPAAPVPSDIAAERSVVLAAASSRSTAGISAFSRRPHSWKSPSRWARSDWLLSSSSRFFSSPTLFRPDFSCSQRATSASSCSCRSALVARSRSSRSLLAASDSFSRESSSIVSRSTARCSSSISTGWESISIRSRDAASSTRSMALSGRNRAVMYRSDSAAAATSAASEISTWWWAS